MPLPTRDLALTFAGGGNRSFYQLGLLRVLGERLLPRVAAIAACSAGACVATMLLAGRTEEAHEFWKYRRRHVTRNFDWWRILARESPAPHGPIYRDTLLHAFDGGGLDRLRAQPFPILVQTTGFPRRLPASLAVALGIGAYSLEKALRKEMLHPELGRALGFQSHVFDARDCETKEELASLILASSATPPFTPLGSFRGRSLLDGGIVDNAPAALADAAAHVTKNVVLLTRPYPASVLGVRGRRFYLAPTRAVPIDRWDYTRPDLLEDTIAMGEREAAYFGPKLDAFLNA